MAYRQVVIQGINDQCNVFAHITGNVIWLCEQLFRLINQVSGKKLAGAFFKQKSDAFIISEDCW